MSRAELLAAVRATVPESESWVEAVRALGRWRQQLTAPPAPAPKQPGRYTGRSQGEQFWCLTKSHVFDLDRAQLRAEFQALGAVPGGGTRRGQMIEAAQRELHARKQAEKQGLLAAKLTVRPTYAPLA